jgi:hypothetical protein
MATWQNALTHETWDDGLTSVPGEEEFTQALVAERWGDDSFNYIGTPNWTAPADREP